MMWIRGIVGISGAMLTRRLLPGVSVAARSVVTASWLCTLRSAFSNAGRQSKLRAVCGLRAAIPALFVTKRSTNSYGPEGRKLGLWSHLPRQRKTRRRRFARKPRGLKIPPANTIAERPPGIGKRDQFGHWEGDLIAFRKEFGKSNLTSLVERRSRYIVLARNPSRHSMGVMTGIEQHLAPLPQSLRRSITFDRGTEFSAYPTLKARLGVTSYFCKPSAPWQKGSVENSNGRVRRFLPLDTDITTLTDADLAAVTKRMNNTPRKCLGFRTPAEVIGEQLKPAEPA